jgi:hypothetical protein
MSLPDATAGAQLTQDFVPAWIAYLDIVGDPVRVTTAPNSLSFSGTGDADLDGQTYSAVDPTVVSIGAVKNQEGGSDTLTCSLSGIVGPDAALLSAIGNLANWRGRVARLWSVIYSPAGIQQGAVWAFYTGRMSSVRIIGAPSSQTVEMDIENYLASLKGASGRTYMDQDKFDAGDLSARLKIAVANGFTKGAVSTAAAPGYGRFNLDPSVIESLRAGALR